MRNSSEIMRAVGESASRSGGGMIGRRHAIGRLLAIIAVSSAGTGCVAQPNRNNPEELPSWSAYRLQRHRSGNHGGAGGGRK